MATIEINLDDQVLSVIDDAGVWWLGRWDRGFTATYVDRQGCHDRLPDWHLLDERGRLLVADASDDWDAEDAESEPDQDEAQPDDPFAVAALAGYVALIPPTIRRRVGALGSLQWVALEAIAAERALADWLAPASPDRGYLLACWSLAEIATLDQDARLALAAAIRSRPRRDLLGALMNRPVSASFVRALAKLRCQGLPEPETLDRLDRLLRDPDRRHAVRHARALSDGAVRYAAPAPAWACRANVLEALSAGSAKSAGAVADRLVERLAGVDASEVQGLSARLAAATELYDLDEIADTLLPAALRDRPFPAPPMPASGLLAPIDSHDALMREARAMKHCAACLLPRVLDGNCYLYRWTGAERATVCLIRDRHAGWTLDQVRGRRNARVSVRTMVEIVETLRG